MSSTKPIGEKALCDLIRMVMDKASPTNYQYIEADLKAISLVDDKGKRFLQLNSAELGMDAIQMVLPSFKRVVLKRDVPNIIIYYTEDPMEVIPLDKYKPAE